jgi:hypothetical protein
MPNAASYSADALFNDFPALSTAEIAAVALAFESRLDNCATGSSPHDMIGTLHSCTIYCLVGA